MKFDKTYFSTNTEDQILEKLMTPYLVFFEYRDFLDGGDIISRKIKTMTIQKFTHLQVNMLSEKNFVTSDGKIIKYIDMLDLFDYYSLLDYEKDPNGKFHKIRDSYKKIQDLCTLFVELESVIFKEISEQGSELCETFFYDNSSEIINYYLENNLSQTDNVLEDFKKKAVQYLESIRHTFKDLRVEEFISLKKNKFNLSNFNTYITNN